MATHQLSASEHYLQHLDNIFQVEPAFYAEERKDENVPAVTSIVYDQIPEEGMITVLTYGLSVIRHPDWQLGRPELCMSVESRNDAWKRVAGYVANQMRGDFPFTYGSTIDFKQKIADDTEMDAFLIFAPAILEQEDYLNIDVGKDFRINIAGLYPIYASEIKKIEEMGLEAFWKHPNFDLYNVNRPRVE